MSDLTIRRLAYPMGAEISGLDLSRGISESDVDAIKAALAEHLLVRLKDQSLSRDDLVGLAWRFGTVDDNSTVKHRDPANKYVTMVSSKPFAGKPRGNSKSGAWWHSDRSYRINPTSFSMLYAVEMPDIGGNTMFSNQYLSYEALSPALRSIADSLSVVHLQIQTGLVERDFPAVIHPLVRTNPETGRKALFLSVHARSFFGMTDEESRPLLEYLKQHATRPEFVYRHAWRTHDLVLWDNRWTMHLAVRDYDSGSAAQPRHLWKCSVQGEVTGQLYSEVTGTLYGLEAVEHTSAAVTAS
jgi:taurine dioxygenase